MLESTKVISAQEMARIEKVSIEAGASGEKYMDNAAQGLAEVISSIAAHHHLSSNVTLLVGKGNNGGDALATGCYLLEKKYTVKAMITGELSPLGQKYLQRFTSLGGIVIEALPSEGIIVDGLFGTGLSKAIEGSLAELISEVNASELPIISIDIPSGLDGNTGAIHGVCVKADYTLYLEMPKVGCFLERGMDCTGQLIGCGFGLDEKYVHEASASGYLLNESTMPTLLPKIERTRHKYGAGYVVAIAGCPGMPGAAVMSCTAAYRMGAGIVRLFHPEGMEGEFMQAPQELVRSVISEDAIFEEMKRARALLIGPGMGRSESTGALFQKVVSSLSIPTLIDADGLFWLALHEQSFKTPVVLTPHHKEMEALLGAQPSLEACQAYADRCNATIVLKGAPTWIFHPGSPALIMDRGTPGLATAGTGDVLAGMIAALLAQGLEPRVAAALGSWLHGVCGERIALDKTEYSMMATDLIEALPTLLSEII